MAQGKRNEPTVQPTEADLYYAAGFVDGEGCIAVRQSTNRRPEWNPSMYASVTVSQAEPYGVMLQWFADRWGGAVRRKPERKDNAREAYEWHIVGQQAYDFLDAVLYKLKIKAPQAVNALRLRDQRANRARGQTGWRNPLTVEEVALQAEIKAEANRLNQRGKQV